MSAYPPLAEDEFRQTLRIVRQHYGLSQAALAQRATELGAPMVQTTVAKIESGQRSVTLNEADVLARVLGLALEYFVAKRPLADLPDDELERMCDEGLAALHTTETQLEQATKAVAETGRAVERAAREAAVAREAAASAQSEQRRLAAILEQHEERVADLVTERGRRGKRRKKA
jgi:transcriptional regulator with XRE-family HTH domain